jgi:acyl-CoA thioester hydrolase
MPPAPEFRHKTTIDVRFRDVDMMGHVNNAVYFTYLEQARLDYFRALLAARPELAGHPGQIVASAKIDYRAPVKLDDRLDVWIRVAETGRTSFRFLYEVRSAKTDALAAAGETVQVVYDYAKEAPAPLDEVARAALEAWEGRPIPRRAGSAKP